MAEVQTPQKKESKPPVKRKNNNNSQQSSQTVRNVYCALCRRSYSKQNAQDHIHGMLHHRELETVLGKDVFHECLACKESSMGLKQYAQHISTAQHKAKLKSLVSKNVKPPSLIKILGPETLDQIMQRNKKLKTKEKKQMRKEKKRLKQEAGRKRKLDSKVVRQEKSEHANLRILKQVQETHQEGSNNAVAQNKENKVSSLQRPPHQREPTVQIKSERLGCLSGEPAGRGGHHPHFRDQFTQSTYSVKCSKVKTESFQTESYIKGKYNNRGAAAKMPEQKTQSAISQQGHYNKQCNSGADFTNDQLPQTGAIIFDHNQSQGTGPPQAAQPALANKPSNGAPIRDVDVSAMLRQIRRALGVREPCRADREARKQNSETASRSADQAGVKKDQPTTTAQSSSAVASNCGVYPTGSTLAKPKQTQVRNQHCENISVDGRDSNELSSNRDRESQDGLDSVCLGNTASSEPNPNIAGKVRIAHEPGKVKKEKPALKKLLSSPGAKSKSSWREIQAEMWRKKQERMKGAPRFGITLTNPLSDSGSSVQAEDFPLSEGFHWESLPGTPSHWTGQPPHLAQGATVNEAHTVTQSNSQMQGRLDQPSATQEGCSSQPDEVVSVKLELNLEEDDDARDHCAKKRTSKAHDDVSDMEPGGKKKKKSNKDQEQMDQLLAVSLREEELSHSLQNLDRSLIQARSTLQAAYAEVQRLLLFRQQCIAEVNGLRARRIEILQGMQGGYSGESNVPERATTSSAGAAAATVQLRLSALPPSSAFPTSSSQQPLSTNTSISRPQSAPLVMPVKREPPSGLCNPETAQVPMNQPVTVFPSELLPSLQASPPLAAPKPSVASLKQLKTDSSTLASPPSESPVRQQEEFMREKAKTVTLVTEEDDSDSEEEIGGNPGTPGPERDQNTSPVELDDDTGNESDASVKMMESNLEIIDIDESDNEGAISNVPVHREPPQKSVSVEFSIASTQTSQQNEDEKKVQPTLVPVKDASVAPESCEGTEEEDPFLGSFENHTGPVHSLQVHEGLLYTCSGDNTARVYSLMSRECQAVFTGHTNKVNCLLVSSVPNMPTRLFTGSSDQTIRCYSIKSKKCLEQISLSDRVLCLHVGWSILFAGLANGSVASYDLKTLKQLDIFECHGPRGVSCLGTAQEGARRVLLVGSYDSTISVRDAKNGLLLRTLEGHTKTVLCMKVVNDLVFSGSSDTSVHAHNIHTGELIRIYKGHSHAVTSIVILGKVMVTACLDKLVRVYELQSHDRLQVYGGHSDMVMCMAIHKSVIYTGCYDGSIQAVKLNLIKNHRCWWQNCSLIFGLADHLLQHLIRDHTKPNLEMVKCRWRGCSTFFSQQQAVRQELPGHMQSHVENDSKVQP